MTKDTIFNWFSNEMRTQEALKEWNNAEIEKIDLEDYRTILYYFNRQALLFNALYLYYCEYKEKMDLSEWLSDNYWMDDLNYTQEYFIIEEINSINNNIKSIDNYVN